MGRKEKVQLVRGAPLHLDLLIDGEVISMELVCPCGNRLFVISKDKLYGGCNKEDCKFVLLFQLRNTADMSQVKWVTP